LFISEEAVVYATVLLLRSTIRLAKPAVAASLRCINESHCSAVGVIYLLVYVLPTNVDRAVDRTRS